MTDREKLIALLVEAESLCAAIDCYDGAVCEYGGEINGCAAFRADHLISRGVVVREKGEWMEMVDCVEDGYTGEYYEEIYYNCLNCDYATTENTPFCPNCGADMRKVEKP